MKELQGKISRMWLKHKNTETKVHVGYMPHPQKSLTVNHLFLYQHITRLL